MKREHIESFSKSWLKGKQMWDSSYMGIRHLGNHLKSGDSVARLYADRSNPMGKEDWVWEIQHSNCDALSFSGLERTTLRTQEEELPCMEIRTIHPHDRKKGREIETFFMILREFDGGGPQPHSEKY